VVATAASFAAGLLFLVPLMASEIWFTGSPGLSLKGWLVLIYLGVGASALTLFLWNYALRFVEASAAALYVNLIPVVGLGFALLIGESARTVQLAGGALAVLGVLLGEAKTTRSG
jgi:drug/metabolite transporter (DMT)-like permease